MNVTIIGELNVDLIVKGRDLNFKWNSEKLVDSCDLVLGSSSAITARALAALGVSVTFISIVGDDLFGEYCVQELQKGGIDTQYIQRRAGQKTGVTLSFSTEKDRALMTAMGTIPLLTRSDLPDAWYANTDHVHFGSYYLQENMREHWDAVFDEARAHNVSTSFDLGWDIHEKWHADELKSLLKRTSLFIPSEDELLQAFPASSSEELVQSLAAYGCILGLKRGRKGSLLLDSEGQVHSTPAYDITPIDTTGAGDSFNAGLIYGYLYQWPASQMLQFANACGAMATLRIGGASHLPDVQQVESFMSTNKTLSMIEVQQ